MIQKNSLVNTKKTSHSNHWIGHQNLHSTCSNMGAAMLAKPRQVCLILGLFLDFCLSLTSNIAYQLFSLCTNCINNGVQPTGKDGWTWVEHLVNIVCYVICSIFRHKWQLLYQPRAEEYLWSAMLRYKRCIHGELVFGACFVRKMSSHGNS